MLKIFKHVIFLISLFTMVQAAISQNYYNAPYTRYKIGDINDYGFAYNRSLGGSSTALRPKNQINYLNPASYTAQDTNTFLFQIGFTGRYAQVENEINKDKSANFNIDYLTVGFPVKRWWKMSLGVTPYSRVQYFLREEIDSTNVGENINKDVKGFGGFNEFYIGTAFEIANTVSIGAQVGYLFGSLDRSIEVYIPDMINSTGLIMHQQNYIAGDLKSKFGIQIHPTLANDHKIVLGATYEMDNDIDVKLKANTLRLHAASINLKDSLRFELDTIAPLHLPQKLSVGLSYSYKDAIMVTGEFTQQDWSGTEIVTSSFKPGKYTSYRLGVEFCFAPLKVNQRLSYIDRIHFRAGGNSTQSYLYYNDQNISSWGLSAGLGLPIKNSRKIYSGTTFNIGYSYGQKGTTDNGLIQEKIQIITFGLVLHDFWFLKPKYD